MSERVPEPGELLGYVARLYDALGSRDRARVTVLLDQPVGRQLPRAVREEALAIVRAPRLSLRVPMQLIRWSHAMLELHRADSREADAQLQFEIPGDAGGGTMHAPSSRRSENGEE